MLNEFRVGCKQALQPYNKVSSEQTVIVAWWLGLNLCAYYSSRPKIS